ncbi:MAG: hypothetical protein A3D44_03205 [Candidatus Staskawiczbacteria bacterium RIFCSPHIGHO2_02_FULL_42_22]|uniref:Uncharacterized protein n=1 Tax=Candidatus Staskawiczbacteria bacterium RIFCSPHIGHO2_02_FULL_42_22 TaxID=1802207 RepID=A0A1G2I5V9_9BACT|nr:MAG: hypothetical protein A3D44_03205 [Candidatus Staskawiczbacteria bacterium RIFCSPHIGHO2_02_FULL_42_22]
MIIYFFWGSIALLIATLIFYAVFFALANYWKETPVNLVVVPLLYTFDFFIIGFVVIASLSIFFQYLPDIIKVAGSS